MERSRISPTALIEGGRSSSAVAFAVCERASDKIRFRVEATAAGRLPVEKLAGLLAVHCLMTGKSVNDYKVLVVSRENLLGSVAQRTQELLDVARSIQCDVRLSPREQEVLAGVRAYLSNKEIGARLNICDRNVKHTVTALFRKFKVRKRVSLICESAKWSPTPTNMSCGVHPDFPAGMGKTIKALADLFPLGKCGLPGPGDRNVG
jgi:DNA-binding CsgD family transcriptional regulator